MTANQVLPHLFIGSCPTSTDDIHHLKTEYGVTAILNFQTDNDLDYWDLEWSRIEARCQELGLELRRIPIRDFDGVDLRHKLPQCVAALDELLRNGQTVYMHCNVGTGLFAQCGHRLPCLETGLERGRRHRTRGQVPFLLARH